MLSATAVRATVTKTLRGWKATCHRSYFTSVLRHAVERVLKSLGVCLSVFLPLLLFVFLPLPLPLLLPLPLPLTLPLPLPLLLPLLSPLPLLVLLPFLFVIP